MRHDLRLMEAILFAASEPLAEAALAERFAEGTDIAALIGELAAAYTGRGVNLVQAGGGWCFRTAEDLASHMRMERKVTRKPSRAAVETLAVIAYHQPVTRSEVEEIRGVAASRGTFDILLEAGWIRPAGRRPTPGRPVTWGTTDEFLVHFGLSGLADLPGVDELRATGLLDTRPASVIVGSGSAPVRPGEDAGGSGRNGSEGSLFDFSLDPAEPPERDPDLADLPAAAEGAAGFAPAAAALEDSAVPVHP